MTSSRRRTLTVGFVLLLAVGAFLLWHRGTDDAAKLAQRATMSAPAGIFASDSPSATGGGAGVGTRVSMNRRNQPAAGLTAPSLAVLPPLNTAVKDVLLQLKEAADRGDSRAACRVGVELSRCYHAHHDQSLADLQDERAKTEKDPKDAAILKQAAVAWRASLVPDLELCKDVAPADYNEAWSYLVQSASAGNAAAAAAFYIAPPIDNKAENAEVIAAWADHRVEYRDMAIRAGNVYALNAAVIFETFGGGRGVPNNAFEANPYNSLMYMTALLPLIADHASGLDDRLKERYRAQLSPAQFEDAQRDGDALRRQFFANATPVSDVTRADKARPEHCGD